MDLSPFWYWINERHNIFLKKGFKEEKPWTKDKILQDYRFCNVFRELDTVTKWIREKWRIPLKKHKYLWLMMAVARQINRIETLEKIPIAFDPLGAWLSNVRGILHDMQRQGEQIYGAAYIITAGGTSGPKYLYTCDKVLRNLIESNFSYSEKNQGSIEQIWKWFMQLEGFGPFLAYEVASDLRWTRYCDKSDVMTWANPGPGAKRGLSRLYYGDLSQKKMKSDLCLDMMRFLLRESRKPGRLKSHVPELEMRDIEHSLCETDKYLRALTGEGRPKVKYDGGGS